MHGVNVTADLLVREIIPTLGFQCTSDVRPVNGKLPSTARARSEEEDEDGATATASVSAATAHNVNCSKAARGGPRAGPRPPSLRSKPDGEAIQGSAKRQSQGLVNFIPAVAYHSYLDFPAAFTKPGASTLTDFCTL